MRGGGRVKNKVRDIRGCEVLRSTFQPVLLAVFLKDLLRRKRMLEQERSWCVRERWS